MGDCQKSDLRVGFARTVKLNFLGSQLTRDAGLLAAAGDSVAHCRGRLLAGAVGAKPRARVESWDGFLAGERWHMLVELAVQGQ